MALAKDQAAWLIGVSARTGIDPRVLLAWTRSEGNPGAQPGYYNYLNIATSSVPGLGVTAQPGDYGTAKFGSVGTGVTAAVNEIRRLGLTNLNGLPPQQAISRIANSGWASGKYTSPGGTPGSSLAAVFSSLWGAPALNGGYLPPRAAAAVANTDPTRTYDPYGHIPGVQQGRDVVAAVVSTGSFLGKITSFAFLLRAGEVVGGAALGGMGLFLLAKQVGLAAPQIGPLASPANEIEKQNVAAGNRERYEDRRAATDARRVERSERLQAERELERARYSQTDEIPY